MLAATDPFILSRQVDLLYRNLRTGQVISIISGMFLTLVAWNSVDTLWISGWLFLVILVATLRMAVGARYLKLAEGLRLTEAPRWRMLALIGAAAGGLTWMTGALLLMAPAYQGLRFFAAFVMAGMVASAVPVVASDRLAFRLYAWPIILAVAVGAWGDDPIHLAFFIMTLLFLLIVTRSADYFNESLHETLRLERETARLAEKLEVARQQAEQSNLAKSQFLANMSHEIRTPMNAVIGMTELALDAGSDEERTEFLRIVKTSANSLLGILNDILDFSKIEAGKLTVENIPFSPADLLRETAAMLEVRAREKGLSIDCQVAADCPPLALSDPLRVRQVLLNLLGNAVKFTEKGLISLHLDVVARRPEGLILRFTVSDTGIGIPPDKLAVVFEAFSQADASTTRKYGGTGLGLSITDSLVRLLGGHLDVESALGQGSTFGFSLPVGLPQPEVVNAMASPPVASAAAVAASRSPSILLVEDNKVNQILARRLLEKRGYHVSIAENGQEAINRIADQERFDLILMDMQMPVLGGIEATQAIRLWEQEQRSARLPIVAMTANAMDGDRAACLAAGMDDYLAKPINQKALDEALLRWLGNAKSLPAQQEPAQEG